MIELRSVMPNSVTNPTIAPMVRRPPVANTTSTPPTSAKGKVQEQQRHVSRVPHHDREKHRDGHRDQPEIDEQVVPRSLLRRCSTAEFEVTAGWQQYRVIDLPLRRRDERTHVASPSASPRME